MTTLRTALGRYPATQALHDGAVASPSFGFAFEDVSPISRAFAPMVREQRYDVSELAIATVLQARAAGKPIVVLPVAVAARAQEQALLCRADSDIAGPADLRGRRIGARAYSQTTCLWLRGILADTVGLEPAAMAWTVFEGAHVAEYADPPWVERAPAGADLIGLLKAGALDAVIVGNDVPQDPALRTVYTDPAAAGERFRAQAGFVPVNHLVVIRRALVGSHPGIIDDLTTVFTAAQHAAPPGTHLPPIGPAALQPVFAVAIRFAAAQGLIPASFREDDIWRETPPV